MLDTTLRSNTLISSRHILRQLIIQYKTIQYLYLITTTEKVYFRKFKQKTTTVYRRIRSLQCVDPTIEITLSSIYESGQLIVKFYLDFVVYTCEQLWGCPASAVQTLPKTTIRLRLRHNYFVASNSLPSFLSSVLLVGGSNTHRKYHEKYIGSICDLACKEFVEKQTRFLIDVLPTTQNDFGRIFWRLSAGHLVFPAISSPE